MNLINFSKANCRNCYRCLRSCPVKAIQIKDEQATIVEERCIACGRCLSVCPQNAQDIKSDLLKTKKSIAEGKTVIASLSPTFAGAFDMDNPGQMAAALMKLGFSAVEETAAGADIVTRLYDNYMSETDKTNLITTYCPSANYLIEKYHPSLIPYMIPVVSPMVAHGKLIRQQYGPDACVVLISPCIAKKAEASDMQQDCPVDAVLTFEELSKWLREESINLKELIPVDFDRKASVKGRQYPIPGGVVGSLSADDHYKGYELLSVNGINQCLEVFQALEKGLIENVFIEMSICDGSCLGGPGMPKENKNYFKCHQHVRDYAGKYEALPDGCCDGEALIDFSSFSKDFHDKTFKAHTSIDKDLLKVLRRMGKNTPANELNCGACGYNSCRDKAKAVLDGMAEISMCLPYMRSKAESLTNVIFEFSPNIIMLIDEELNIMEFNPTSEYLLNISAEEAKGKPIGLLMDDSSFASVIETKQNIYKQKIDLVQHGLTCIMNLVYLEEHNLIMAIMTDVTPNEKRQEELARVKLNTLEAAQEVINKQMRVAQEIAGLLGETTAETKVILTKLKNIVVGETGDLD